MDKHVKDFSEALHAASTKQHPAKPTVPMMKGKKVPVKGKKAMPFKKKKGI